MCLLLCAASGVGGVVQPEVSSLMDRNSESGGRQAREKDERGGRSRRVRCTETRYKDDEVLVRKKMRER